MYLYICVHDNTLRSNPQIQFSPQWLCFIFTCKCIIDCNSQCKCNRNEMRLTTFGKVQINIKVRALDWQIDVRLDQALKASFLCTFLFVLCKLFSASMVLLSPLVSLHTMHWTKILSVYGNMSSQSSALLCWGCSMLFYFILIFFFPVLIMRLCRVKWTVLLWNFKVCMLKTMEKR